MKNIAIDFVDLLLADIFKVVLGELAGRERIRRNAVERFEILGREKRMLERGLRLFDDLDDGSSVGARRGFGDAEKLTGKFSVGSKLLYTDALSRGVAGSRDKKFVFLLRKAADDFVRGKRRRRSRFGFRANAAGDAMFRRRREGSLGSVLCERGEAQTKKNHQ